LASSPTEVSHHRFKGRDGFDLAFHELGEGRPLVLIHGLFSSAQVNWIKYGHAAAIAAKGYRVIMPDLRGHGESNGPGAAFPPDVLVDDGFALIDHLGLTDYDLGGYSLGGRTTARLLVRGAKPGKAIIAGMGLTGLLDTGKRVEFFRKVLEGAGTHERGSNEYFAEAFLKSTGGDAAALRPILDSFVDSSREDLAAIDLPVLVITGEEDHDNGSPAALAALLPHSTYVTIPGNHMSAVTKRELGRGIATFLAG